MSNPLRMMQAGEHDQTVEYLRNHLTIRTNGFIEIGSAWGGSFVGWASVIDGPAISIDLPHFIGVTKEQEEERNTYWTSTFGDRVYIIAQNSQDIARTHQRLDCILGDNKVDFLFIDGNHDYGPTYTDFYQYRKYVRSGGLVGFHDINHPAHQDGCRKVFDETVGVKWMSDPVVADGWAGIGILHVD